MAWEVDFNARPLKLELRKTTDKNPRPQRFSTFALPDSLYRVAARRALARLADENRELRMKPWRRQRFLATAIAEAVGRWARHRWPGES